MKIRFLSNQDELTMHWPAVEPLLAPVVEEAVHGEYTLEDLHSMCESGRMTLAVALEAGKPVLAMAFEFRHYPRLMAINLAAVGGRGTAQATEEGFFESFREFARMAGAGRIEASCSPAMARMLERYGFNDTYRQVHMPV